MVIASDATAVVDRAAQMQHNNCKVARNTSHAGTLPQCGLNE